MWISSRSITARPARKAFESIGSSDRLRNGIEFRNDATQIDDCRPRRGESDASVASQSRAAFFATVSSTGWISVGELAITPRISLVAVCCSNDSLSSWNSRTFSRRSRLDRRRFRAA